MICFRARTAFVVILILTAFIACSKKNSDDAAKDVLPELVEVAKVVLASGEDSPEYSVDVPAGGVSLTIIADGGDAGDMDISSIIDPDGNLLIAENPEDDPIGRNFAQAPGQSAVAFTVPHSDDYDFITGTWRFTITHWKSVNSAAKETTIYTITKSDMGETIDVNLWLVGLSDYEGEEDPVVAELVESFETLFGAFDLKLGEVNHIELTGEQANRLTYTSLYGDENDNAQADDLDEIFALSGGADNRYFNFFLVTAFSPLSIIGMSGGIPGPQLIQGTAHSGVVISLLGGLSTLSKSDIELQGETMAHELGHYLGLFHTTERNGLIFDPISDTAECDSETYDINNDGYASADECEEVDGFNLMFWAAASYSQDIISAMQINVVKKAPVAR